MTRSLANTAFVALALSACSTTYTPKAVDWSHRLDSNQSKVEEVGRYEGEDVLVRVMDPHPVIYNYSLRGVSIQSDDGLSETVRAFFGVRAPKQREDLVPERETLTDQCQLRVSAASGETFHDFVDNFRQYADVVHGLLARSDREQSAEGDLTWVGDCLIHAADSLRLRPFLSSSSQLERELQRRFDALATNTATPADSADLENVRKAAPGAVRMTRELQALRGGTIARIHEFGGSGRERVEVVVTPRLDSTVYVPARLMTGSGGVDVAVIRRAYETFSVSYGTGLWFGERKEFRLKEAGADSFKVKVDTNATGGVVPALFLNAVATPRSPVAVGASAGLGLAGSPTELSENTAILALITVGWNAWRFSAGAVSLSLPVSADGLKDGELTTDPNILTRLRNERSSDTWRFTIAIHGRP